MRKIKIAFLTIILLSCKKETVTKSGDIKTCDCYTITEYGYMNLNGQKSWLDRETTTKFKDFCSNANADWIYDSRGIKRWKQICN